MARFFSCGRTMHCRVSRACQHPPGKSHLPRPRLHFSPLQMSQSGHEHVGSSHHHAGDEGKPSANARYFCPMHPEVESDGPGSCPKCGMALERNPAWKPEKKVIFTCPMHPQIQQDHPGNCPICGMALEPKTAPADSEEDDSELRDMGLRFWIGAALTLPIFVLAMAHLVPALSHTEWVSGEVSRWTQFVLSTPVVVWAAWPFFQRAWA